MQDSHTYMERDWSEEPRSEMLERVILAVDCARGDELERLGEDAPFVRYVESALFPFLEAKRETALRVEA